MDIVRAADYASQQTDRWLFVATLVIVGIAAVFIARYFVRVYERLLSDFKEAIQRYEISMQSIITSQQKSISELSTIIASNSSVLAGCRDALEDQTRNQAGCVRLQEELRRINERKHE